MLQVKALKRRVADSLTTEFVTALKSVNPQGMKSSLYSLYYAKACYQWRSPPPRLSAWATHLQRNVTAVASHWRLCVRFNQPGIRTQTSITDSDALND